MQIEVYEQRILIPEDGKWLYNATDKVVSDKVYLGKEADATVWTEINEEEKQKIEEEMEEVAQV